jgi:hypothetical protein
MAKKSSESSRPEKLVHTKAEDIFSKPLTKQQRATLDKLAEIPDMMIDYSDIPPLADDQLAQMTSFRLRLKSPPRP